MALFSIVGAACSIVSIVKIATRWIGSLGASQQRWIGADMTISLLARQPTALKAVLDQT